MGFTKFADGHPQCVICNKVLPNSSIFPANFKRNFKTHLDFINKTANYLKEKVMSTMQLRKCLYLM